MRELWKNLQTSTTSYQSDLLQLNGLPKRAPQEMANKLKTDQDYKENQADKITEYAEKRGIEIMRTYADEGKSGGRIGHPPSDPPT